jgi:hypothetical protein
MRVLRHPRRDRPEPEAIFRGGVGPQDAPDVPITVEHVVVFVRLFAARDPDTTRRAFAHGFERMLPRAMGEMLICHFLALRK